MYFTIYNVSCKTIIIVERLYFRCTCVALLHCILYRHGSPMWSTEQPTGPGTTLRADGHEAPREFTSTFTWSTKTTHLLMDAAPWISTELPPSRPWDLQPGYQLLQKFHPAPPARHRQQPALLFNPPQLRRPQVLKQLKDRQQLQQQFQVLPQGQKWPLQAAEIKQRQPLPLHHLPPPLPPHHPLPPPLPPHHPLPPPLPPHHPLPPPLPPHHPLPPPLQPPLPLHPRLQRLRPWTQSLTTPRFSTSPSCFTRPSVRAGSQPATGSRTVGTQQ